MSTPSGSRLDPPAGGVVAPPAPWRLTGRLVVVPAPLSVAAARRLVPAALRVLPVWPGTTLALLVLGLYGESSTLHYGEIAGVVGPVVAGGRPAGHVTSIWVDDERSVAGGRELWGLPKEMAAMEWRGGGGGSSIRAADAAGGLIVDASWREPRARMPVSGVWPFAGALHDAIRLGSLSGTLRLAPTRVRLGVPAGSPLAALGLDGARLGFAGRLDVQARVGPEPAGSRRRPPLDRGGLDPGW